MRYLSGRATNVSQFCFMSRRGHRLSRTVSSSGVRHCHDLLSFLIDNVRGPYNMEKKTFSEKLGEVKFLHEASFWILNKSPPKNVSLGQEITINV